MLENKGFTIIELIVVIAVIGILILLASPRYIGFTKEANIATMESDIKTLETAIINHALKEGEYPVKGVRKNLPGEYFMNKGYHINYDLISDEIQNLANDPEDYLIGVGGKYDGKVFYNPGVEDRKNAIHYTIEDYRIPSMEESEQSKYVYATDSDFQFLKDENAPNIYDGVRGYYRYKGTKTHIIIPEKIHGNIVKDYYKMFDYVSIVQGVASNSKYVTNTSYMFSRFRGNTLDISHLYTSNVTDMSYMFNYALPVELTLDNLDTSKVEDMSQMFYYYLYGAGADNVSLDLSHFDTSSVTNMRRMFDGARISSLNLNGFNTSNVKDMNHMFLMVNLDELNLSSFDISNIENMSAMFSYAKIKKLDISSFNASTLEQVQGTWIFFYSQIDDCYINEEIQDILVRKDINSNINFIIK